MAAAESTVEKLSAYRVGQTMNAAHAECEMGKTKPPARYSEDTLIRDMENASKFAKSQEERDMLRKTEGIGTARTRAPTLANLLRRELITSKKVDKKHEITSSPLGREMIGRLPVWLTDVATTAKWEMLLSAVERGEADPKTVLDSQIEYVKQVITRAKTQIKK